jgi:hypothetical protein
MEAAGERGRICSVATAAGQDIERGRSGAVLVSGEVPEEPAWAMLEALDVWGNDFLKALDDPDAYEAWFASTPNDIASVLAISSVSGDIRNGGMDQCFWNPFGTAAPEALLVLREVGLKEYADLLDQAIARFGSVFPRSRAERMTALDTGEVQLADLDEKLFELIDKYDGEHELRLNAFAAEVIQRHRT